jgi:hypothetical protein
MLKLFLKIKCLLLKPWLCNKASFILWCENHMNKASMNFIIFSPLHRFLEDQGIFKIFCGPYFYFCWMVWGSKPIGGKIFCTFPDEPWGPPVLYSAPNIGVTLTIAHQLAHNRT